MQSFLSSAADFLLDQSTTLHRCLVVMPSRRAGIFLERELSKKQDKPRLAPEILSIDQFIERYSGYRNLDQSEALLLLYQCYQNSREQAEPFDEFLKWAPLFLSDLNEIDRHLVPAQKLFAYLGDIKRLETWDLKPEEERSEMIEKYLALWQSLSGLYELFQAELLKGGRTYQGHAYRLLAEGSDALVHRLKQEYEGVFFFGFNALNQAEEHLFKHLFEEGIAQFYWDVDQYYFEDLQQEAGQFLRQSPLIKLLKQREAFHGLHQCMSKDLRTVRSLAVPGKNQQAFVANQLLESYQTNTALVFADEELLNPFLENLHPEIEALNLSMGLSLRQSPLANFFELLLQFALEKERSRRKDQAGHQRHYHRLWMELLAHPFLRRYAHQGGKLEKARQKIIRQNALYRSWQELELEGFGRPIPKAFFEEVQAPAQLFALFADLCQDLRSVLTAEEQKQMGLFRFYQSFKQLEQQLQKFPFVKSAQSALRFYRDLVSELKLDLRGEPLKGLQVMGVLETRCLDFDHVVICSLNEGVLPKGRSENSLIPFEVKKIFQLPTYLDKDAVYAYHFYRLIQRAQKIDLLYQSSDQNLGKGEPSRFIRQLEMEWPKHNPSVQFSKKVAAAEVQISERSEKSIPKTPEVMQRLAEIAEKGFSATALISYLRDPLDFYHLYLLDLKQEEAIEEEAEYRVQGNILHHLLERFYQDEEGLPRSLNPQDPVYAMSRAELKTLLQNQLQQELPGAEITQGPNVLVIESLSILLERFLKAEKAERLQGPIETLAVEEALAGSWTLKNGQLIHLKGFADRIDRLSTGAIRIVDYKSGGGQANLYQCGNAKGEGFALQDFIDKPLSFQLAFYAYLYRSAHPHTQPTATILGLRKKKARVINMRLGPYSQMDDGCENLFKQALGELLEEIFDPSQPFVSRESFAP